MRSRIVVDAGDVSPASVELSPGLTVTIGRSRENVFVVRDDLVSRLHAKIYHEDGRWLVRDFGLNGTLLNGEKLQGATELSDDTTLTIGTVRLRYLVQSGKSDGSKTDASPQNAPTMLQIESDPKLNLATGIIASPENRNLLDSDTDTQLRVDELTALCRYMTTAVALVDQQELIRLSLRTLLNQTSATFVGYLGLDPSELTPKMVVPERVPMDISLSKRLTEQVRLTKKRVWLFGDSSDPQKNNASLSAFTDAVCLPITAMNGEPIAAIHAYRAGRNFIERDVQFLEAVSSFLTPALENHRNRRKILAENLRLRCASSTADELIGDSSALMNLRMQIGRAAPLPFTVLINGESGSGKELVALALHRHSPRAGGPIVVVNCAAIAPSLLEAELFGFRKGAFAGADRDQAGMFEQADDGTLFLDEVADLSLECQAKLLRVIEGKSFRPVGGARETTVDVRVVAATHRDLEQEVKAGKFRQDLLFRLKVITIRVPALREHSEDILELSRFFLERLSHQLRKQLRLSPEAEQRLLDHSWPGNVRQLRAVLESAAVMSDGDVIEVESLGLGLPAEIPTPAKTSVEVPSSMDMDDLETWAIRRAMKHTSGNVSQAARVLGISRDTLHTKLKKKNIDRVELLSNSSLG